MDLGIAGKTALVCGASKGLGYGCAEALVREGVNVVIVARGAEALEAAAKQLADAATAAGTPAPFVKAVAADITTEAGRAAVFALGHAFDIVVTNAGGPPPGDFRNWEREDWIKAVDANMLGWYYFGDAEGAVCPECADGADGTDGAEGEAGPGAAGAAEAAEAAAGAKGAEARMVSGTLY